jgi:hypothetical protein
MGLLGLSRVSPALRHLLQVAGQEAPQSLAGPARRVQEIDEHVPHVSLQSCLLDEFALGARERRFLVGVEQTGRRLEQVSTNGVPVLPDEQHAVVLVESDDPHRAGMDDQVAGHAVLADQDVVRADIPHGPRELRATTDNLVGIKSVRNRSVPSLIHRIAAQAPHAPIR